MLYCILSYYWYKIIVYVTTVSAVACSQIISRICFWYLFRYGCW